MTTYNYTISPIPYNGGTISSSAGGVAYLGGQRFFRLFQQTTPTYIMGAIIDYQNPMDTNPATNTATNTATVLFTNDTLTAQNYWHVVPLSSTGSSNAFLLFLLTTNDNTTRVYPMSINADKTINVGTPLYINIGYPTSYTSSFLYEDNKVIFYDYYNVRFATLTYDPATNTVSRTNGTVAGFALSSNTILANCYSFKKIPGSTKLLAIYNFASDNNYEPRHFIVDPSTFAYKTITPTLISSSLNGTSTAGARGDILIPLSESRIVELMNVGQYRLIDTSTTANMATVASSNYTNWVTFSSIQTAFSTTYTTGDNQFCNSFGIDNNHFALVWRNGTSGNYMGMKIGRIIDNNFGDCSPGSNVNDGITIPVLNQTNKLVRLSSNLFMNYNNGTFRFITM